MEQELPKGSDSKVNKPAASRRRSTKNSSTTTRSRSKKPVGLGDVVEKVTDATGIKKLVKGLTTDCGCDRRRERLNRLFPFYKEMTLEQKNEWEELRILYGTGQLINGQQMRVNKLYNEVFKAKVKVTKCSPCMANRMARLEDVYQLCSES